MIGDGSFSAPDKSDQLRNWLRGTGYADDVVSDIANAFSTLSMHGILNLGSAASGALNLQEQAAAVTTLQDDGYPSGSSGSA